jgi:uncharacterized membrane protein YeiB
MIFSLAAPRPGRPRLVTLDVPRGFTLCEILLANIQLIANDGSAVVTQPMDDWDPPDGLVDVDACRVRWRAPSHSSSWDRHTAR